MENGGNHSLITQSTILSHVAVVVGDIVVVCVNDKTFRNGKPSMQFVTLSSVAKVHSCSSGFCKTNLGERGQVFWTALTLSPSHVRSRPAHRRDVCDVYIVVG